MVTQYSTLQRSCRCWYSCWLLIQPQNQQAALLSLGLGSSYKISSCFCVLLDWLVGMQLERDEVRLRRTVGLNKDVFSIDRKQVP